MKMRPLLLLFFAFAGCFFTAASQGAAPSQATTSAATEIKELEQAYLSHKAQGRSGTTTAAQTALNTATDPSKTAEAAAQAKKARLRQQLIA